METIFLTATIFLLAFAIAAVFDGFYLHIVKYRLYQHSESKFEHFMHLLRACFFPFILYFLYIRTDAFAFWFGTVFVILDILVLGIDAYSEKDSRAFMGGLPRSEYILHLFVNGLHFAGLAVMFVAKVHILPDSFTIITAFDGIYAHTLLTFCAEQLLPGAILLALVHIITGLPRSARYWDNLTAKISVVTCCR